MVIGRYNYLIDEYYRAWFYHHPEKAVDLGVPGYADRLAPYGDDDSAALVRLHEKLLAAIDEMDQTALDEDQRIDVELMQGQALIERKQLLEQDWRECDPSRYLPVNAIYQLTVREVKDPRAAFTARLAAIPEYLRGARTHLLIAPERIPALWLSGAVEEAEFGARYFRELTHHPRLQNYNLDKLLEQAALALEEFAHFLAKELAPAAQGDVACGRGLFETLLRYRHGLDISADQLHAFGERLYQEIQTQLRQVTRQLRGDEDVSAMNAQIRHHYAAHGNLLSQYRDKMLAARQFVKTRELVSLPEAESLTVIETPQFMRHRIPFAAYWDPMPTDPKQQGIYYVTLPRDGQSAGEHNLLELQHTCVHEAWPGHHLQFVTANRNPTTRSVPRLINTSATLYEGWALYCEQLMVEQGFLSAPESTFVLLKDRLWRALRIVLDVELHTRHLSLTDAAKKMESVLGFSHEQAMSELYWYSQSPTVPMGYATGWALINQARQQLLAPNQTLDLQGFHDRLLACGSIALPTVLRRQFGESLWQSVRQHTFAVPNT
jgi:uncharacterized protein (DUF885 family)